MDGAKRSQINRIHADGRVIKCIELPIYLVFIHFLHLRSSRSSAVKFFFSCFLRHHQKIHLKKFKVSCKPQKLC
jgi:hypothetical protein